MSKKLLAAALAAAFLATGGTAKAGDYVWNGSAWTPTVPTTDQTLGNGDADTYKTNGTTTTAGVADMATGTKDYTLNHATAALTIGAATDRAEVTLKVTDFTNTAGTATIAANGTLNVAGDFILADDGDSVLINAGTIDVATGGTLTLGAGSVITNTGTVIAHATADANKWLNGLSKGNGQIGTLEVAAQITGADLQATTPGDVEGGTVKITTKQNNVTQAINVGGADLELAGTNSSNSISAAVTANTVTLTDATEFTGSGAINAVEGVFVDNAGANKLQAVTGDVTITENGTGNNSFEGVITGSMIAQAGVNTLAANADITGNLTIGADAKVVNNITAGLDFTGDALVNGGILENDTSMTIAADTAYSGDGVIDNTAATALNLAGNNANVAAIMTAVEAGGYDGASDYDIGDVFIKGALTDNIILAKATDGNLDTTDLNGTAKAIKINEADLTIGKGVYSGEIESGDLTVALGNGETTTLANTVASTDGGAFSITGGAGGNEATVVVQNGLDGFATAAVAANQILRNESEELDLSETVVTNGGSIINTNGSRLVTASYNGGGTINNTFGGIHEIDGENATELEITTTLNGLAGAAGGDIGQVEVSGDIGNKSITANPTNSITDGTLDVTGKVTADSTKTINSGGADLILSANNNNTAATIAGDTVTISGDNGQYDGAITAQEGVHITGSGNEFTARIHTASGDVDIDDGGDYPGGLSTGDGNINISNGGTFGELIAENSGANDPKKGHITAVDGFYNDNIIADRSVTFTSTGEGKLVVDENVVTIAQEGDIAIKGTGGAFHGTYVTDIGDGYKTILKKGTDATITGVFETDFVAEAGSTWRVAGGDVKLDDTLGGDKGSINADGANVEFGLFDSAAATPRLSQFIGLDGAPITMTYDTRLTVDLDAGRAVSGTEQEIFDEEARKNLVGLSDPEELAAYLEYQNFYSLADTGEYYLNPDDNKIYYNHDVHRDPNERIDFILDQQGIGWARGMISDDTLASQFAYAQLGSNPYGAGFSNEDKFLTDIFRIASSGSSQDLRSADEYYAIEQWKNGADWAGAVEAVTDTVRNFNRAITNRAYNIGHLMGSATYDECGNIIEDCGGYKNRIWAGYTGQWGKNKGRSWNKGYEYDAHGFNLGYDHVTSSGVGFGAVFGYSKGDYDNYGRLFGGKSKIDNYSFGLFASYNHSSGFFSTISGSYTRSKYKMNTGFSTHQAWNNVGYDRAKYNGDTWSVGGKLGYDIRPVANLTITPTIGLYYYDSHTSTFGTTFRDGMKYSRNTLEMPIDVTMKYDIAVGCDSTLSLMATGGYAYNFRNKGTKIESFDMGPLADQTWGNHRYVKPGSSSWNVGGGVQFRYRSVDVGVHYEYYGRRSFQSHSLNANVGYSF